VGLGEVVAMMDVLTYIMCAEGDVAAHEVVVGGAGRGGHKVLILS